MSAAHEAHGAPAHAHHDHDHFDGEPAHELSPGEPRTPGWLLAVGLALFTLGAIWLLVGGDSDKAEPVGAADTKPAAAAPAHVPPPEDGARARMRPRPGRGTPPPAAGTAGVRKLTPQQIEELKKRIEKARQQRGAHPPEPGK